MVVGMNVKIELLPAPHERKYSKHVADYLLKERTKCLGLEFPTVVEEFIREYASGERSYERLRRILIGGEVISPHFERGYRPLLQTIPQLNEKVDGFVVRCYENPDIFDRWVLKRDEFVLQLLTAEDYSTLDDAHEELVKETRRRNESISRGIKEIAGELEVDLYVVIGRLHAPFVKDDLDEDFDIRETVLEDACLTPLDESLIRRTRGEELQNLENYLKRHRQLAREASRKEKEIMELLRSEETEEEYDLKKYSFF